MDKKRWQKHNIDIKQGHFERLQSQLLYKAKALSPLLVTAILTLPRAERRRERPCGNLKVQFILPQHS